MFFRAFHAGGGQGSRKGYRLGLVFFAEGSFDRRLICADIWRVWARYREGLRRSRATIWGLTISPPLSPDVLVRLRLTSTRQCETRHASPSSRPWLSRDSSHTSGW
uniref:Uncharacterized protein n=1 Tax=Ananas comosus var. bracteatus TaxID=296719 RepID=A0A6V7P4W9_ANACO|nr:unnamed protein product [Ananas comosus var. bracteatus]